MIPVYPYEVSLNERVTPRSALEFGAVRGGQRLILHEICALLAGRAPIWIPFYCDGLLVNHLVKLGHKVIFEETHNVSKPPRFFDAVYFGTPTLVDNTPLFPESIIAPENWTKAHERDCVRTFVQYAESVGASIIVSGLGSGDISVAERLEDMGDGATVCCFKCFDGFEDYVLARRLK